MDLAEEERRITERMNKKWLKMQAEIEASLSGTAPYVWDDDICFATIVANGVLPVLFESFRQ